MFRTIKRGNRYHFVTFKSACRFAAFCGSQALPADGNYIVFGVTGVLAWTRANHVLDLFSSRAIFKP
jgi:hypothetical protein